MFDLSPEKILVLLTLGLVVLGPDKLPAAARTLAGGLVRARRLATSLTEPVQTHLDTHLAEPRRLVNETLADARAVINPLRSDPPRPDRANGSAGPDMGVGARPGSDALGSIPSDPGLN